MASAGAPNSKENVAEDFGKRWLYNLRGVNGLRPAGPNIILIPPHQEGGGGRGWAGGFNPHVAGERHTQRQPPLRSRKDFRILCRCLEDTYTHQHPCCTACTIRIPWTDIHIYVQTPMETNVGAYVATYGPPNSLVNLPGQPVQSTCSANLLYQSHSRPTKANNPRSWANEARYGTLSCVAES